MIVISSSRKEKEREFKRGLIGEASLKLFLDKSFETVTVEDIARESEFGKGTIYQLFNSKEEILVYVFCQIIKEVCEEIQIKCLEEESVITALENLIEVYNEFQVKYHSLFISFVRRQLDGALTSDLVSQVFETHDKKMFLMKQIIERGIEKGVIVDGDSEDITFALESMIRGLNTPFNKEIKPPTNTKDTLLIKQVLFKGILK